LVFFLVLVLRIWSCVHHCDTRCAVVVVQCNQDGTVVCVRDRFRRSGHRSGAPAAGTCRTSRPAPNTPTTSSRRSPRSPAAPWRSSKPPTPRPRTQTTETVCHWTGSLLYLVDAAVNRFPPPPCTFYEERSVVPLVRGHNRSQWDEKIHVGETVASTVQI